STWAVARAKRKSGNSPFAALTEYCSAARRVRDPQLHQRRSREACEFARNVFAGQPPVRLADNPFLSDYLRTATARYWRERSRGFSDEDRLQQRGNVIVLKSPSPDEKGVLLLKYTPHFYNFLVNFDLVKVMQSFHLVLEPSWFPYPEPH